MFGPTFESTGGLATNQTDLLNAFVRTAGGVTRRFPGLGARVLDRILYPLIGNDLFVGYFAGRNRARLKAIDRFENLLVVSDIHIGDAVLFQTAVSALRDFFPRARIDYMVGKTTKNLLEGNPEVSELWPVFTGGPFPNDRDRLILREMSADYDAVFNFCPFFSASDFPQPSRVFHFTSHAPVMVRNERRPGLPNHIAYQAHQFLYDLLFPSFPLQRCRAFAGPEVFLRKEAVQEAGGFLESKGLPGPGFIVFLNPDTASPYTRVPFSFQARILAGLVEIPCRILLGAGHTEKETGKKLLESLPLGKRGRVALVPPSLSLEAYTALLDWSDVFISGDTGPLHLAAAWKNAPKGLPAFRNRTSVVGLFGATPPRFSGYDSRTGYLESEQKAECYSYQSASTCRNLTCMHKMGKECGSGGCFQDLDTDRILSNILNLLKKRENIPSALKS